MTAQPSLHQAQRSASGFLSELDEPLVLTNQVTPSTTVDSKRCQAARIDYTSLSTPAVSRTTRNESKDSRPLPCCVPASAHPVSRFHWAFLIGPKVEKTAQVPGRRCHVKNRLNPNPHGISSIWEYEEVQIPNVQNTATLLVRVVIGKVENLGRLLEILRSIPVIQNDPGWRCRTWCANALTAIAKDGTAVGTSVLDWQRIEQAARRYAGDKTVQGRFASAALLLGPKPTWDLLENKEIVA